ncbi:MAG: hypothetical protein H7Z41_04260, partial [Cytophagales bacterium]|nr:hypothetical protein [Armatimonadota bacterium]
MRRSSPWLSPLAAASFVAAALLPASSPAQVPSPPAPMPAGIAPVYSAKPIAKGVRLLQMVLPQGAVGGPLIITTIEVDPRA